MDFIDVCPPNVVQVVETADLGQSENGDLFSWIAGEAPLDCQVMALSKVADRMGKASHPQVIDDFSASAATYSRFLKPRDIERIASAYRRMEYHDFIAANYFNGLRQNRIDIRDKLRRHVQEDWSFAHPRQAGAATWALRVRLDLGELHFERSGSLDDIGRGWVRSVFDSTLTISAPALHHRAARLAQAYGLAPADPGI